MTRFEASPCTHVLSPIMGVKVHDRIPLGIFIILLAHPVVHVVIRNQGKTPITFHIKCPPDSPPGCALSWRYRRQGSGLSALPPFCLLSSSQTCTHRTRGRCRAPSRLQHLLQWCNQLAGQSQALSLDHFHLICHLYQFSQWFQYGLSLWSFHQIHRFVLSGGFTVMFSSGAGQHIYFWCWFAFLFLLIHDIDCSLLWVAIMLESVTDSTFIWTPRPYL